MIVRASEELQVWITTHSQSFAEAIRMESGISPIRLAKVEGKTRAASDGGG